MNSDKLELIKSNLDYIQAGITTLNTLMKPENDNPEQQPILVAIKVLIDSFDGCLAKMGNNYKKYYQEIVDSGTEMVNSLNQDHQTIINNIKNIENELNKYKKEGEDISTAVDEYLKRDHKEPKLHFNNSNNLYDFDVDLISRYPDCYLWELYKNPNMWLDNGDIYVDHNDNNYEYILKYMNNDDSLLEDIKKMNIKKRNEFVDDLDFLKLPVKVDYMNELYFDDDKMKMEAWKNNRVIMVNGKNASNLNKWLKKNGLFENVFNKYNIENIKYFKENNIIYVNMKLKYGDFIEDYCKNDKINEELIKKEGNINGLNEFENELKKVEIDLNEEEKKNVIKCFYSPLFINISSIIQDEEYDFKLQEWVGSQCQWKLIYKASEHEYTAESFHEYCDDKGPTLIIIKSSEGWILGGYTTQSWSGDMEYKDDSNAFIFTLKNPHNVPPTKYNKRKESDCTICCNPDCGPVFYGYCGSDICIRDNCNQSNSCSIDNNGKHGYKCDSNSHKSLFVNTDKPDNTNYFSVLDYEVYTIDNYNENI